MLVTPLFQSAALSVADYRCDAKPHDRSFVERHRQHSISYVRRGSFGCRSRGRSYELVAGALFVGSPEQEYVCSHEHHDGGDECLSFQFGPALIDAVGEGEPAWQVGWMPPLPQLVVLGELGQAAAEEVSHGIDSA